MITLNHVGGVRLCFPLQAGQWAVQLCSFSHCLQHKTIYTHTSSAWVFCHYPNCRSWITFIRLSLRVNGRSWWFSHVIYMYISISFKLQSFFLFMRYKTCISDKIRNWKWSTETISHPARLLLSTCTTSVSVSPRAEAQKKYNLNVHVPKHWGKKQVHCINKEKQIFRKYWPLRKNKDINPALKLEVHV